VTERIRRFRQVLVLALLVSGHFVLRPFLGDARAAPDLLLLALIVFAIRARPGDAAVAGFIIGLLNDALAPLAVGAGALSHTCVGWLAAWGKAVFFAESLLVSGAFFFGGTWFRDVLMTLAGRPMGGSGLLWEIAVWSPLRALTTAVAGTLVLVVFHRWLDVRIEA
jgi:rod shape-determining protein MreD